LKYEVSERSRVISYSSQHNTDIALKKSLIEKKLEESGEKQRLEEHLRQKLIECGWKDELKKYCLGKYNDQLISFRSH
jgi:hypothetical protein